jgi:hypothetical protein
VICERYSNVEFVLSLDINEGIKLTDIAIRRRQEEALHREWVGFLPHTEQSKQKSFAEYVESRLPPQIEYENQIKSKDELMSDILGKE